MDKSFHEIWTQSEPVATTPESTSFHDIWQQEQNAEPQPATTDPFDATDFQREQAEIKDIADISTKTGMPADQVSAHYDVLGKHSRHAPGLMSSAYNTAKGGFWNVVGNMTDAIVGKSPYRGGDDKLAAELLPRVEWYSRYLFSLGGLLEKGGSAELKQQAEEFTGFGPALMPLAGDFGKAAIEWGLIYPKLFQAAGLTGAQIAKIPQVQKASSAIAKAGGLAHLAEKYPATMRVATEAAREASKGGAVGMTTGAVEGMIQDLDAKDLASEILMSGVEMGGLAAAFGGAAGISKVKLAQDWVKFYNQRYPGLRQMPKDVMYRAAEAAIDTQKVKIGMMTSEEWGQKYSDAEYEFVSEIRKLSKPDQAAIRKLLSGQKTPPPPEVVEPTGEVKEIVPVEPKAPVANTGKGLEWLKELDAKVKSGEALTDGESQFVEQMRVLDAEQQGVQHVQAAQAQKAATIELPDAPAGPAEAAAVVDERAGETTAKEPWEMTNREASNAVRASNRETLERARPLLAQLFAHKLADWKEPSSYDPWGIVRAIEKGDEIPRIPWALNQHKELVRQALSEGKPVPAEVLADYPDLAQATPPSPVTAGAKGQVRPRRPEGAPESLGLGVADTGKPGLSLETSTLAQAGIHVFETDRLVVYRDSNGKPIGTIWFKVKNDGTLESAIDPETGDSTNQVEIFVDPKHRRQGVATAMWNYAREKGYDFSNLPGQLHTQEGQAFAQSVTAAPQAAGVQPPAAGEIGPPAKPGATVEVSGKGMRPGFAGLGAPEGMAGANVPPVVVDEKDLREPLPEVEFKEYTKDIGPLAANISTLSNAAQNTNNPVVIKIANELVDTGLVIREEMQRRVDAGDREYAKLPKEYKGNNGEQFMELMDRELSPEQIDAATDIPQPVKPILKYFKQLEEDIRLDVIQQKRAMAQAVHMHQTVGQIVEYGKEKGLNWTVETRRIGGLEIESVRDVDADEFLNKEQAAKTLSEIDIPDSWGRQWAHIQHIFFGQYKLKVVNAEGKVNFIGTAETQAEAVDKLLDWYQQKRDAGENMEGLRLTVDRDFHMPFDMTRLSTAQYYHLQSELKTALEAERSEIEDATRGIVGKKASKRKFWGALMQRKGTEGYSTDFLRVWRASVSQYVRWKRLSAMNASVTPQIEDLRAEGLPGWANHLEFHRDNLMGRKRTVAATWLDDRLARIPGLGQYIKPFFLERYAGGLKTLNYFRQLQTARFYVVNSLQPLQTLWPVVGEKGFYRAVKMYYSAEGRQILQQYGIETEGKFRESGLIAPKKSRGWTPAALSERRNQGLAFLGLFDQGKRLGMSEAEAARYARLRGQVFTQFAHSPADLPKVMMGNLGGLVFQYKRFTVKNLELVSRLAREGNWGGVGRWLVALLGVGGASVFLRLTTGLPVVGYLSYKAYEYVKEHYGENVADVLHHGLPGLIGIDVSGSVTPVDVPYGDTAAEKVGNFVLGPTGQTVQRLVTDLRNTDVANETGLVSRGLKSLVDSSPTVKQFVYLVKAFQQDTSNLDAKQREAYQLEVVDLWKKALGFIPETEGLQRMQITAMLSLKEMHDTQLDKIALARIAGKDEEAAQMIVRWNGLWPEAPISVVDSNRRVYERRQAAKENKIARTRETLPRTLKPVFPVKN